MRNRDLTGLNRTVSAQSCVKTIGDSSARRRRTQPLLCFLLYLNSIMDPRKAGIRTSRLLATTVCRSSKHRNRLLTHEGTGSTGSLNPNHDKDTPPALPPCQMAGQSTHRSLQPSQRCHSPAPQAPTAGASTHMTYMSDSLALEPCASDATIDPTWDSGPPAASIWSVKKRQKYSRIPEPIPKPPLPVCIGLPKDA